MAAQPPRNLAAAPFSDILRILLLHFQPQLKERGLPLSNEDLQALTTASTSGAVDATAGAVAGHIADLVAAQLTRLRARWGLRFAESLRVNAADLTDWRTTADLLTLASDKAAAETDIALGAALLVAFGRREYTKILVDVIVHDAESNDVDAIIARRVLRHISGIQTTGGQWLARVDAWRRSAD